jgi:hypothetical protein
VDIQTWWDALDALARVLYAIAIPASCALLIQLVLILIGLGHAGGVDAGGADGAHPDGMHHFDFHFGAHGDVSHGPHIGEAYNGLPSHGADAPGHAGIDGDSAQHPVHDAGMDALRLFTLSGIVSFFTVFGWSSIILYQSALPGALAVISGLALGYGAMYGAAKLVQWSIRLQEDGNLELENAVGQTARVYIPIPAVGGGEGKVTLTIQEQFVELSAVTWEAQAIPSGAPVRVMEVKDGILTVARVPADEA